MGFSTPTYPAVDPETFVHQPLMERIKILTVKWVDYGYGTPSMVHLLYIVKLVFFYALGGIVVATVTSGLPAFWHVSAVVEPADRLPESDPVDGAAGTHRPGRIVGPAGRQDQADDRRIPILGAAQHHSVATMAAGAVHRGRPAHLVRRRRSTWR